VSRLARYIYTYISIYLYLFVCVYWNQTKTKTTKQSVWTAIGAISTCVACEEKDPLALIANSKLMSRQPASCQLWIPSQSSSQSQSAQDQHHHPHPSSNQYSRSTAPPAPHRPPHHIHIHSSRGRGRRKVCRAAGASDRIGSYGIGCFGFGYPKIPTTEDPRTLEDPQSGKRAGGVAAEWEWVAKESMNSASISVRIVGPYSWLIIWGYAVFTKARFLNNYLWFFVFPINGFAFPLVVLKHINQCVLGLRLFLPKLYYRKYINMISWRLITTL